MAGEWDSGIEENYSLGRRPSGRLNGYVYAALDAADARTVAIANTPNTFYGMLRTGIELNRLDTLDNDDEIGDWEVRVVYGLEDIPVENEVRFSASTKGGREKVTQCISTFDSIGVDASNPAADTGGAIGLDSDGNVNGVEIIVPKPRFSLEMHVDFSLITDAYWYKLELATGRVNSKRFKGRQPHEVVFEGTDFDGTRRVDSEETSLGRLRFDFAVSRESIYDAAIPGSGVVIEGLERGISKRGWDYLDIQYGEVIDAASQTKVQRPVMAWSRQVMDEYDFNKFGIN
jgi:hypothetical protein